MVVLQQEYTIVLCRLKEGQLWSVRVRLLKTPQETKNLREVAARILRSLVMEKVSTLMMEAYGRSIVCVSL